MVAPIVAALRSRVAEVRDAALRALVDVTLTLGDGCLPHVVREPTGSLTEELRRNVVVYAPYALLVAVNKKQAAAAAAAATAAAAAGATGGPVGGGAVPAPPAATYGAADSGDRGLPPSCCGRRGGAGTTPRRGERGVPCRRQSRSLLRLRLRLRRPVRPSQYRSRRVP